MRHLLFWLVLVFVSCNNETPHSQLTIKYDHVLREAPGEKKTQLRTLKQGENVVELGKVSDFESLITLGNERRQSPWVQVKTDGGETGWVFGGAVEPVTQKQADWLLQKRMQCYFGMTLTARRNAMAGLPASTGDADFAARYRDMMTLRDTFVLLLARRAEPSEANVQLDFSWMVEALPGFVFQKIAEGTQPYLFAHYGFFQEIAAETNGLQDDAFIATCLTAFASDSIESFFPAWKFQYSDYEAASQLGTGTHLKMLREIEAALKAGSLFQPELLAFKEALLDDVLSRNTVYWQSKELILKELGQILAENLSILDARDRAALEARSGMFENPEANGVRLNLRGGSF